VSIKNKLVTAVTTAGLLAGLFGSAFVPAANAAEAPDVKAIKAAFDVTDTGYDTFPVTGVTPTGSASKPYTLYSPTANTDGDTPLEWVCADLAATDLVNAAGDELGDFDDVTASVTFTGALLGAADDTDDAAGDLQFVDEDDYEGNFSDSSISTGIGFCATVDDDDATGSGTVTVKVNGTTVATYYINVVGPAVNATLAVLAGEWIAMNNVAVANLLSVAYTDKAGTNLRSAGIGNTDIDDFVLDGGEGNASVDYYVDSAKVGDEASVDATVGANVRRVSAAAGFCDETEMEVGESRTIYVVLDRNSDGDRDTTDPVSNGIAIKCSDEAANWVLKGLEFAESTVNVGDYVYLTLLVEDGSGNPLGLGIDADLGLNMRENTLEQDANATSAFLFPTELDAGNELSDFGAQLMTINEDDTDDGYTLCPGDVPASVDVNEEGTENLPIDATFDGTVENLLESGVIYMCYQASYSETGDNTISLFVNGFEGAFETAGLSRTKVSATIEVVDVAAAAPASTVATIARNAAKSIATITIPAAAGKLVTITK